MQQRTVVGEGSRSSKLKHYGVKAPSKSSGDKDQHTQRSEPTQPQPSALPSSPSARATEGQEYRFSQKTAEEQKREETAKAISSQLHGEERRSYFSATGSSLIRFPTRASIRKTMREKLDYSMYYSKANGAAVGAGVGGGKSTSNTAGSGVGSGSQSDIDSSSVHGAAAAAAASSYSPSFAEKTGEGMHAMSSSSFSSASSPRVFETDSSNDYCCSFKHTGESYYKQDWYTCLTCGDKNGGSGMCAVCKDVCHKGHSVVYGGKHEFYCDCGGSGCAAVLITKESLSRKNKSKRGRRRSKKKGKKKGQKKGVKGQREKEVGGNLASSSVPASTARLSDTSAASSASQNRRHSSGNSSKNSQTNRQSKSKSKSNDKSKIDQTVIDVSGKHRSRRQRTTIPDWTDAGAAGDGASDGHAGDSDSGRDDDELLLRQSSVNPRASRLSQLLQDLAF